MKKVLTLIMALGVLVAFTSVAVAGICGGPQMSKAQANADSTNTQQNDHLVVAQAEMTEDTSPADGTDEEATDGEEEEGEEASD